MNYATSYIHERFEFYLQGTQTYIVFFMGENKQLKDQTVRVMGNFKYLDHIVSCNRKYDTDLERQR